MLARDSDMASICYACIGDEYLSAEVKGEKPSRCKYCGETREAIPIGILADRVHEYLEEHFELQPSDPTDGYGLLLQREGLWPDGDPVSQVISDVTQTSQEVADDVKETLHQRCDYPWDPKASLEIDHAYGSESHYRECDPDDSPFRQEWTRFQNEIRSSSRFFSVNAKNSLDFILGDLTTHEVFDGRPVIREIGPAAEDRFIWRARVAQSTEQLKTILKSPTQEIGSPSVAMGEGRTD